LGEQKQGPISQPFSSMSELKGYYVSNAIKDIILMNERHPTKPNENPRNFQ